ncbi:forkhead box protein O4-like [Panulirus ornatus]|uniref:forkhead box protein O4-like n=1 Tax=Panulirus ornatus TaxID=150431 RepID=UPI003A8821E0
MMDCMAEVMPRGRCNTWPPPNQDDLPPRHYYPSTPMPQQQGHQYSAAGEGAGCSLNPAGAPPPTTGTKKGGSTRRNAWGGQSYADLITSAISSAPDGRLTLAQIYDWVVANIPYFKDKGDSNSSAGWKVRAPHLNDASSPTPTPPI